MYRVLLSLAVLFFITGVVNADSNVRVEERKDGGIAIIRPTVKEPLLVFNAPEDGRPYVHPLLAPDGNGTITEFSPGHHKHQTGIYVGFLKVNGRDYFHNHGGDHFRRTGFKHSMNSEGVRWTSTYELLDKDKKAQLVETQSWHFRDFTKTYLIDFTWSVKANADVTFDKYEYGGLFIRMPWKNQPGAKAINSERHVNGKAEGQKASWVDIGMTVDGRTDEGHVAVISHELVKWRVDGQLGVGPAPTREKELALKKGERATFRYRFYVYTGEFQKEGVQAQSVAFGRTK